MASKIWQRAKSRYQLFSRTLKSPAALNKGHTVSLMIHEVFGAWTEEAVDLLYRMSEIREGRLDKEFHSASRTERSFNSYYATRISVALHVNMAIMIRQGVRDIHT